MLLAVEQSTAMGSVAVFKDGQCIACREYPARMAGGTDAGAMIAALLSDIGRATASRLAVTAITHCAVGVGPGSFSGIRSVLGYLQGFCAPRRLPLIGIPGAAACARALVGDRDQRPETRAAATLSIIGDARRGHYWLADYRWDGERIHEVSSLRLMPYDKFSILNPQSSILHSPEPERIHAEGVTRVIPTAREVGLLALDSPALHCAPLPLYLHPAV